MKTLKEIKVGDRVRVVKLHGKGSGQTPYHGHGTDKGCGGKDPKGCASGRSHRDNGPRL